MAYPSSEQDAEAFGALVLLGVIALLGVGAIAGFAWLVAAST